MDRRAFLRALGFGTVAAAAAATSVLDLERLLWVPGEKTIFLPPPSYTAFNVGDVFTIEGIFATHPITEARLPLLQKFVVTANVTSSEPDVPTWPSHIVGPSIDRSRGRWRIQPLLCGPTMSTSWADAVHA